MHGTIAVDLDGTLAHYDGWRGHEHIGAPIPAMIQRVHDWLREGRKVVIFTARAYDPDLLPPVYRWLQEHGLGELKVTNIKTPDIVELWDDRAVQIRPNTGLPLEAHLRNLLLRKAPHGHGCTCTAGSKCSCWKREVLEQLEER